MASHQEGFGYSYQKSGSGDWVYQPQAAQLGPLYQRAAEASKQNTVAGFDPYQQQAQQQAADYAQGLAPYTQSALQGNQFLSSGAVLSPDSNPYLQQYAQSAIRPVFEQLTQSALPSIRDEAAMTGNVGGSRQGIAEGLATQGALNTAGDITSSLYSNAYGQGLGAMAQGLGLAPQTANLGLLPANILESVGGERQALAQRQLDMPFQNLSMLAQILGDPTILNRATSSGQSYDRNFGGSFGS